MTAVRRLALVAAAVVGVSACGRGPVTRLDVEPPPPSLAPGDDLATVTHVVDGDTLVVEIQGRSETIRLIGVDTPETVDENRPVQCFGQEASRRLAQLAPEGSTVRLERDRELRDRYGRLLAYAHSPDGVFINLDLVAGGFGAASHYPPNTTHVGTLERAQRDAQAAGRGLWGSCEGPDQPLE